MLEPLTEVRFIRHYDAEQNFKIYPVYKLGKSDPDGTVYVVYRTFPRRTRVCLPARFYAKLSYTKEQACSDVATPLPNKIAESFKRDLH